MLVSPLCHESFSECADGNQPIRFSFSAFSLSEKRFRERCFSDSISKVERVPTVFPQKSLIIFSSKREKSVEYRVRGTFPEKKFPPTGCKIGKKCGIQGEEVFFKKLFAQTTKKCGIQGERTFPEKKFPLKGYQTRKKCGIQGEGKNNPPGSLTTE